MQASLTPLMNRIRWQLFMGTTLVATLAAVCWYPWLDGNASSAPKPSFAPGISASTSPTTKSDPALAPASDQTAAPTPALTLLGTTVGGASSLATVRRAATSQTLLLRVGDRIDAWTVIAIESDRIVLGGVAAPPVMIEIDRRARTVPMTPAGSRSKGAAAASQEQPAFAEGEAPWDAGPDFRH